MTTFLNINLASKAPTDMVLTWPDDGGLCVEINGHVMHNDEALRFLGRFVPRRPGMTVEAHRAATFAWLDSLHADSTEPETEADERVEDRADG